MTPAARDSSSADSGLQLHCKTLAMLMEVAPARLQPACRALSVNLSMSRPACAKLSKSFHISWTTWTTSAADKQVANQ